MVNTALAATANQPSPLGFFIPLILVFLVFFFLVIRPQRQKYKKHMEILAAIKVGDVVVTAGGIVAKVITAGEGDELLVEISSGVEVKVIRKTISEVMPRPGRIPAAQKRMKEGTKGRKQAREKGSVRP